jgi:hypothetical protein
MPFPAMHPIQDLFLESFSYELQFDMHSYLHKKNYSCKKWVLQLYSGEEDGAVYIKITVATGTSDVTTPIAYEDQVPTADEVICLLPL